IDNLGCPAWDGVTDPVGFTESGWFNNDAFWWTPSATDWAYSTPFWPDWHPAYAPATRYATYVIDGVNHWMTGLCDWNIVLDSIGGPNHVNNYAAAPVMIDYQNDIIYYTPYYYILKQFSRSMRPGDVALGVEQPQGQEQIHLCAVRKADGTMAVNIFNAGEQAETVRLQIGGYHAEVPMPAHALKTLFITL
ncbi:MAG: glycoside hydrolase family 30 beta sandwich domain-containing protein, partial [Paludibacteraceae bacterium]